MIRRVRHPGQPPADIDLGPASPQRRSSFGAVRLSDARPPEVAGNTAVHDAVVGPNWLEAKVRT